MFVRNILSFLSNVRSISYKGVINEYFGIRGRSLSEKNSEKMY